MKSFTTQIIYIVALALFTSGIGKLPAQNPARPTAGATAGNLMQASELGLDYFTGKPDISVPLYVLPSKKLSVPISLRYNAGGVKVEDLSSPVGMGWSLDALAIISSLGLDSPDTLTRVTVSNPLPTVLPGTANSLYGLQFRIVRASGNPSQNSPNVIPDYYSIGGMGFGGKFFLGSDVVLSKKVLDANGKAIKVKRPITRTLSDGSVRTDTLVRDSVTSAPFPIPSTGKFLKSQNLVVQPYWESNWGQFWIVMDAAGNKYVFGGKTRVGMNAFENVTTSNRIPHFTSSMTRTRTTTNWYINRIISADASDTIYFDYDNPSAIPSYYVGAGQRIRRSAESCCNGAASTDFEEVSASISNPVRLTNISGASGYVQFSYSNDDRLDLPGDRALQRVNLYARNGALIRYYQFSQSYWNSPQSSYRTVANARLNRLFLNAIQEFTASGQSLPPYSFTYFSGTLPARDAYFQDYWGYFNGSNNISNTDIPSRGGTVNASTSPIGTLSRITLPSGGATVLVFENHSGYTRFGNWGNGAFLHYPLVGGLRIKSIIQQPKAQDNDTLNIVKTYLYTSVNNDSASGRFHYRPEMTFSLNKNFGTCRSSPTEPFEPCTRTLAGSLGPLEIPLTQGAHIGYKHVVEVISANQNQGRTEYAFTSDEDFPDYTAGERDWALNGAFTASPTGAPITDNAYRRGLLKRRAAYKFASGTWVKISQEDFNYGERQEFNPYLITNDFYHQSAYLWSSYGDNGSTSTNSTPTYVASNGVLLLSKASRIATDNGSWLPEVREWFSYEGTTLNLSHKYSIRANGDTLIQQYRYPINYQLDLQNQTGSPVYVGLRALLLGYQLVPVMEALTILSKSNSGGRFVLAGSCTEYENISMPNGSYPLPVRSYTFTSNTLIPLSSFTQSYFDSGRNFVKDSRYRLAGVINNYGNNALPVVTNNSFRVPTSVRYGYNNSRPTVSVKNGTLSNWLSDASAGYLSFEEPAGTGSFMQDGEEWFNNFGNTRVLHSDAFTGRYVLRALSGAIFEKPYLPTNQSGIHVFSAWVRASRPVQLSMYVSAATDPTWWNRYAGTPGIITFSRSTKTDNSWELVTVRLDLNKVRTDYNIPGGVNLRVCVGIGTVDNTSSEVLVDEVRFMALDAAMATTTYDDFGRVLDQTDAANNTVRYQYDSFGRLEYTWSYGLDGTKRVVSRNQYAFFNQFMGQTAFGAVNPINTPINRVTQQTALADVTSIAAFNALGLNDRAEQEQYTDGLGRPILSVAVGSTPSGYDMVQSTQYDSRGLVPRSYLPMPRWVNNSIPNVLRYINEGDFRFAQNVFYTQSNVMNQATVKDSKPFADAAFEASPAARVLSQTMAGTNWNGKTSTVTTRLNNTTDDVIRFVVHRPSGWVYDMMNPVGSWPAGSLLVQRSVDVDGRTKETFTNLEGQMVLSRVLHRNPPNGTDLNHPSNWAETYYCYDDFGRLCFVFQPEGVNRIRTVNPPHWPYNNYEMSAYLFIYRYDQFGRIVEKCTPGVPKDMYTWGGNTEYIVYNPADMPIAIMTDRGDARTVNGTRQREWSFITYDALGRKARTGLWHDLWDPNRGRAQLQAYVDADLAPIHKPLHESRRFNSNGVHYTRNFFDGGSTELAWSIYDDYDANLDGTPDRVFTPHSFFGGLTLLRAPRHLPTMSFTRVLGTNNFLESSVGYDARGRAVHTYESTYLGGYKATSFNRNATGAITDSWERVRRTSASSDSVQVSITYELDHRGRLKRTHHRVHGQNGIILGEYQYNELSQLTTKRLHAFNSSWLQTIDYTYNIQGWLTKINDRELSEATDLFGMEIGYERGILGWNDNTEFGGNISALSWRVRGQGAGKYPTYAYFYDRAGRFTSSFYADRAPNGHNDPFRYDEHLIADGGGNLYDRNGNAAAGFFRNFFNTGANTTVDYLGSIYSGNRLANTRDQGTDLAAMPYDYRDNGATATNTTEYSYDPNGNITNDANAGVSIAYNHLNLVTQITKGTGTIAYTYAADGTLLARSVNGTVATEWMGGFVYKQNGALDYIHTPEGRVVNTPTGFEYEYHYTDHLGSTRLTWRPRNNNGTWTAQIQEVYNYYAYGTLNPSAELGHSITAQTYQYRYTGQWNETALGLNYYRFPARLYDPALGRFTGVDPMAASEGFGSPYAYVGGNPINYSDPTGMARRGIERDDIGGRPTGYSFRSNQLAGYNLLGNFDFYTKSSGLSSTAGPSSPQDTPSGGQWVRVSKEEFHAAAQAGQRVKGDGANEWYVWQPGAEQEGAGFISEYDIPFWGPSKRADEAFRSGTLSGVAEGFFWSGVAFTDLLLVRAVAQTGAKLAGNTAASISTRLALSFEAKLAQRGILGFTEHGAQQMTARGFTQEAVLKIIKEGAVKEVVYNGKPQIHYVLGKYVIATDVTGQFAGKIITIYGDWNVVGANGIRGIFTGF